MENLFNTDIDQIVDGFRPDNDAQLCLFCGERFEEGRVYTVGDGQYTGRLAARRHIALAHGDVFSLLIGLGREENGLTEVQQSLLPLIHQGLSDRDIAARLGGIAESTVRNHRFHLRRKAKEAKIFLALMSLLEKTQSKEDGFMEFNAPISVQDDRVIVTKDEEAALVGKYLDAKDGLRLLKFPKKQKAKLVVLNRIAELFDAERRYTEKEVNAVLTPVYSDYVTIRRYLIEYGFMDRKPGGGEYWRK